MVVGRKLPLTAPGNRFIVSEQELFRRRVLNGSDITFCTVDSRDSIFAILTPGPQQNRPNFGTLLWA